MNGLLGPEPAGATPLEPEDMLGLRRTDITLRRELNRAEAENIAKAVIWCRKNRVSIDKLLTQRYLLNLHQNMFGQVWKWAGKIRLRETSIGVNPHTIRVEVENLLLNVLAQTLDTSKSAWSPDEIAIRFHHHLVSIHPFVNGNGRHARLAADLLALELNRPTFTWGNINSLSENNETRQTYLKALRTADRYHDYAPLLSFARS